MKRTWLLALPYPALLALVFYYGSYGSPFALSLGTLGLGVVYLLGSLSLIEAKSKKIALYANVLSLLLSLSLFLVFKLALPNLNSALQGYLLFKGLGLPLSLLSLFIQGLIFALVPKEKKGKASYLPKDDWLSEESAKRLLWLNLVPYPLLLSLTFVSNTNGNFLTYFNAFFLLVLLGYGTYGLYKGGTIQHFFVLTGLSLFQTYYFYTLFRYAKTIVTSEGGSSYLIAITLDRLLPLLVLLIVILQGLVLARGLIKRKKTLALPHKKARLLDYLVWLNGLAYPALFYFDGFILDDRRNSEVFYGMLIFFLLLLFLGLLALYRRLYFKDYLDALFAGFITSFELGLLSLKKLQFFVFYPEGLRYVEPIAILYFMVLLSMLCFILQGGLILIRRALIYLKSDPN